MRSFYDKISRGFGSFVFAQLIQILFFYPLILAQTDPKTCKEFEGKYISYYDEIYKVTHCVRVVIEDHSTLFKFLAQGGKIHEVDAETIKKLPEEVTLTTKVASKNCRDLEGKYVTYTLNEMYLIDHCKKRVFLDWESYKAHSLRKTLAQKKIIQLSWEEFSILESGPAMDSDTDEYFKRELALENLDIIPYKKACKGLEGRVVAYYHELYRIEDCRKRLLIGGLVPSQLLAGTIIELDSQRWLSLPLGRPIEAPPNKKDIEYEKHQ